MWLEFLVEEQSAEAALNNLVPIIIPKTEFRIHSFRGKRDFLRKLPNRLRGYRNWIQKDHKIIVLVDCDKYDCYELKNQLETIATNAGLTTLSKSPGNFQVINRIAIEELEAWFFGDVEAIRKAYPRVPKTLGKKAPYRSPDEIKGGTWEQLERVLKKHHPGGLEKIRAASEISEHMDPDHNRSPSFQVFRDALRILLQPNSGA